MTKTTKDERREALLRKIRALSKLSDSTRNASDAEAALAAAKVRELMREHCIAEIDLADDGDDELPSATIADLVSEGVIASKKVDHWQAALAAAASRICGAECYLESFLLDGRRFRRLQIFGLPDDVCAARATWEMLRSRCNSALRSAQSDVMYGVRDAAGKRSFTSSFRLGFATTVRCRADELVDAERAQAAGSADNLPVVARRWELACRQKDTLLKQYAKKLGVRSGGSRQRNVSSLDGFHAGRREGNNVPLGRTAGLLA